MPERPILFSGELVRAILDGRKTQTRRVVKPQPEIVEQTPSGPACGNADNRYLSPYGQPGDRLWVRETHMLLPPFSPGHDPTVLYRADNHQPDYIRPTDRWRPSIFMPRWASRITLEITDIRVERVQEISDIGALKEGAPDHVNNGGPRHAHARFWFQSIWDSINATRGQGWDVNPWVWVVEFRTMETA